MPAHVPWLVSFAHFSLDVPWIAVLLAVGGAYTAAFARARHRPGVTPHQTWKLASFLAGLGLIGVAVLSPLEHYGNSVLWVNFTGFLVLTMLAPPLLWLGSPLTLAFRVASPHGRRRLRDAWRSRIVAKLTFPAVSWLLFAVVTFLWQLTRLTDEAARHPLLRDAQQASLVLAGLWFWLPVVAADPLRWRLPYSLRALYVFVEMTHKALFGAMFLAVNRPLHPHFAANLPGWAPSPMLDQRVAIGVLWVGGNIIFLLALVCLVVLWMQYEVRSTARLDRRLAIAREADRKRLAAMDKVFRRGV